MQKNKEEKKYAVSFTLKKMRSFSLLQKIQNWLTDFLNETGMECGNNKVEFNF
jgi:hypothetical protein